MQLPDYDGDAPGAAMAVLDRGTVAHVDCRGLADLESRTPVTPATNFRLASVTKPFITQGIGILVERGLLRYDDVVFEGNTVLQLLTHTSNLVDYEDLIPPDRTEQLTDRDVLGMLRTTDRTGFHYSNGAYVLLGLLIERVSGRPLEDFLRDEIFAKHGMHGTTLGPPPANRAYGYDRDGAGNWVRRDQSLTSATRGDGGIYSSIDDLARWCASLRDDATVGWFTGDGTIYHLGDSVSFRNAIVRWPAEGLAVIVLTNRNEGDPLALAERVRNHYYLAKS
jgi:CubicO group peptidase (beta-lactamase class C family)